MYLQRFIPFTLLLLHATSGWSATSSITSLIAAADPAEGKKLAGQCVACHNIKKGAGNKIGPNLWNVVNRGIAKENGFNYSAAFKAKTGVWNYENLNIFLSSPSNFAPGTFMALPGIADAGNRAHIIRFLSTLSDQPTKFSSNTNTPPVKTVDTFGTDWPVGEGRDTTGYACSSCHSLAIVKQQGQTRAGWDELIDWMIEEQGMSEPSTRDRQLMLNYLSRYFGVEN